MSKLVISATITSFFFGLFGVDWGAVDQKIENEFPQVSFVSTTELNQLYRSGESLPVIIDVREEEEFQVSHLEQALNIKTGIEAAQQIPDKNAEIIVYCSVGYRSANVAAQLESLGYTKVRNLRHSIFEWANKGYPMSNAGGDTAKAHPFNRAWGKLLNQNLHQYDAVTP
ncbi:MAG: rhodanese-like domain-containing protein [Gammaproteobacteria bacterium]|nr:rhodanese-like domain-containing protein [Gammaproteobacteria bacterium]